MLSKSRILALRQCRRRLWLEVNRPELRIFAAETRRRFAQGHQLNTVVRQLYPDGVLIDDQVALGAALRLTARHLDRTPDTPLFEATFSKHRILVRADLFTHTAEGFELTEVKSSTRVKPYHLIDCAVQNWVITEAGYPIAKTVLAHIDTRFLYRGNDDYAGLLRHVDVTERLVDLLPEVPEWVAGGLDTLSSHDEPDIRVGPHCNNPFACPFLDHCSPTKTEYPVTLLPGGGRIIRELIEHGVEDVRDIPSERLHKPLHQRVHQATLSGLPYIGPEIGQALGALPYPRYYLDFESVQFVIPRWADTRPYQQLPFQWSCHIESAPDSVRHTDFLHTAVGPPMRACADTLIEALGSEGPIFCYSRYERTVIHQLAARFPDLKSRLHSLAERLFDLLPLIREHYYHPAMKGSYSIKAVLPTVAPDLRYEGLGEVHDGVGAQIAYEELIDDETPDARRAVLVNELKEYCRLDTLAMVRLVQFFDRKAVRSDGWRPPR